MKSGKTLATVFAIIALVALATFGLFATGILGSTPSETKAHDGGEWTYGASAGRAFSQYMHPDEWHRAGVKSRAQEWSDCVAPGEVARVTAAQSLIGRNKFYAEKCEPAS